VRDAAIQRAMVDRVAAHAAALGLQLRDQMESPLRGPAGNREFLVHLASA
jgi:predicted rRNA methylase YqxC with S4 and FtsJ domains